MLDCIAFRPALTLLLAAAILTGCGGGDATTDTSPRRSMDATQPATAGSGAVRDEKGYKEPAAAGPALSQIGGKGRLYLEAGREASSRQFKAVAAIVHGYLDARAESRWAVACAYLSTTWRRLLQSVAESEDSQDTGCPATLERKASDASRQELRAEAALADVGSVRIRKGSPRDYAFVLYRGIENAAMGLILASQRGAGWGVWMTNPKRLG